MSDEKESRRIWLWTTYWWWRSVGHSCGRWQSLGYAWSLDIVVPMKTLWFVLTWRWSKKKFRRKMQEMDEKKFGRCTSCNDEVQGSVSCKESRRTCGHHCECSWLWDKCCWCGEEFGEKLGLCPHCGQPAIEVGGLCKDCENGL